MKTYFGSFSKLSTLFLLLLGVISSPSVLAEATISQGNITMTRSSDCDGEMVITGFDPQYPRDVSKSKYCAVIFKDKSYTGVNADRMNSRGKISSNNASSEYLGSGNDPILSRVITSHRVETYPEMRLTFLPKAKISFDAAGAINMLDYSEDGDYEILSGFNTPSTKFPPGYYAIMDSTGLYWSAYLEHQTHGNNSFISWGKVDDPQHPWQVCSATSSFNRATGCGNGANPTTPTPTGNASIFDGAGSIISPVEDCYGCNKDWANMQPHQNSSSTVVFQWRTVPQGCKTLAIGLPEEGLPQGNISLPVTISAKTWSDTAIRKSYTATLSKAGYFALESLGEWTTFAVTSNTPLTNSVTIEAKCADGFSGVAAQEINAANVLVDNAIQWMGTGSVISRAQQGDKYGYGMTKDVSIGSNTSSALTSFQWDSSNCSSLQIGNDTANAKVFGKVWNGASFDEMCNSLPCNLNNIAPNYYIFKIVSSAGAFPNDAVTAVCR